MKNVWKSRYDYPDISNVEKYMGRKLHIQDNSWLTAKVLIVVLIGFTVYLVISGDLNLTGVINLYNNYLR
jgi:hypothetical protein